jgi:DNA-binding beta-propeller fold protein YncE
LKNQDRTLILFFNHLSTMRTLCTILLVCLIGIASVSALTVNPAAVPALKTLAPTPQPTVVAVLVKPQTIVSDVWVTLEINSLPSGATITVDGQSTMQGTTPYKIALHPGSHTILLTLDGYKDYTTTVNLQAGYPVAFDAQLQRVITAAVIRENLSAVKTVVVQSVTLRTIDATASPTQDYTIACLSGQECLTLAEAGDVYAAGWYYTEGSVCGYNGSVPKYCIGGSPKMTVRPESVQAAISIHPENTLRLVNASHTIAGNFTLSPSATPRILGAQRQVGFVDSIFGFFSGLFGQKVSCPSGTVNCGGGCVDTRSDSLNCGACDYTCFDPGTCCGGECIDVHGSDPLNCGACDYPCFDPGTCCGGECVDVSVAASMDCGSNPNTAAKTVSAQAVSVSAQVLFKSCNYTYITQWGTQGTGNGQFNNPQDIAVSDSTGEVYVTELGLNRVQKFDSNGGYIAQWGTQGTGNGQFNNPRGIAVVTGDVYVVDSGNSRVQRFKSWGDYVTQWGTKGEGNDQLKNPIGIAVESSGLGNIYVADFGNSRVQKFNSAGGDLRRWGTYGSGNGQLIFPRGIALGSSGNVYVTEYGNHRVQKFDSTGNYITQWGTQGSGNGQFNEPSGIAVDSWGYVYVVDSGNNRVQKFNSTGSYISQWGTKGSGNGQFNTPLGIAVDLSGKVYVTDFGNHRVQKFGCI